LLTSSKLWKRSIRDVYCITTPATPLRLTRYWHLLWRHYPDAWALNPHLLPRDRDRNPESFLVPHDLACVSMPRVSRTGRCYLRLNREAESLLPLTWDDGGAWEVRLEMGRREPHGWVITGVLCRGNERLDLAATLLVTQGGFVITREWVVLLAEDTPFEWLSHFRKTSCIEAPEEDTDELLTALL
jgi:hypothetical protein